MLAIQRQRHGSDAPSQPLPRHPLPRRTSPLPTPLWFLGDVFPPCNLEDKYGKTEEMETCGKRLELALQKGGGT